MDNLIQNFNHMINYYFYSGKAFERLLLPCILVILAIILARFLFSFFFQIDARLRQIKKLNKSFDNLASKMDEQVRLVKENQKKFEILEKTNNSLLEEQRKMVKSLENLEKLTQELKSQKVEETVNKEGGLS